MGLASLSYGVLGALAPLLGHEWWLATIVAFAVFYVGAAIGHVREIVSKRNMSPGNAGPILLFDIAVPTYLLEVEGRERAGSSFCTPGSPPLVEAFQRRPVATAIALAVLG